MTESVWRASPQAADELAGYRLEDVVGRGGMGTVFRAEHITLGRTVALKVMNPSVAASERFRARFKREARLAASIDHPNIVSVFDAGECDEHMYIAMQFVSGTDLARLLERRGRLDPAVVGRIVAQIAGALDAAHGAGLVHRDVKPANVLLQLEPRAADDQSPDGLRAYLTDFGVTRDLEASQALTATGALVGSVQYAAPEQIEKGEATPATDVYALGCLAYECLTGDTPFRRDRDVATLWAHINERPEPLSTRVRGLGGPLDRVVGRALEKSPEARWPSCGAFAAALDAAVTTEPGAAAGEPAASFAEDDSGTDPHPAPVGPPGTDAAPVAAGAELAQAKEIAKKAHSIARRRRSRAIPARLEQIAAATTGAARVVVVGERKRGKSTLINALIDAPDLLPRDVDVATNTYIEVLSPRWAGRPAEPCGVVHLQSGDSYEVELADLGRWAAEQGNPGNARQVAYVQVLLTHPLLEEGLVIVDTPGLGGLASAHGTMTLTALDQCDALILMLNASAPAGVHELDFLEQAWRRTKRVLIVESAGAEATDAQAIVAADRAAMRARDPVLGGLPVTVVAPVDGHDALTEGDARLRAELRELSNIDRFAEDLRRLVLAPVLDAQAAVLAEETASCLAELAAPDRALLAALGSGDSAAAGARLEEELKDAERRGPVPVFDARFMELRREVDAQMQTDVARRRDELLDEIEDQWSAGLAKALPERCQQVLADAAVAATETLSERAGVIAMDAAQQSGLVHSGLEVATAGPPELDIEAPQRIKASRNLDQERLLGWVTRGGPLLMIGVVTGNPVLAAIGVVMVAAGEQVQSASTTRRRAREQVQRLITRGQVALRSTLDERAGLLREAHAGVLSGLHEARMERLRASIGSVRGGGDPDAARQRIAEIEQLESALSALAPATAMTATSL